MTKKELKLLFDLIIRSQVSEPLSLSILLLFLFFTCSQSHSGPPPASFISSQGKEGIEFIYFLKLAVLVSIHCLSKTPSFSSLYSTPKAKADVMLFNWGFADPLKIRSVQDRLSRE
jgi:hypothetical protein